MATPHCTARLVFIYALCEPDQPWNVRYIGRTVRSLAERLKEHLDPYRLRNTYKCNWIKSLTTRGLIPIIRLIDCGDDKTWSSLEQFHIAAHIQAGFALTNGTLGGDGIPSYSPVWAVIGPKISASNKGRQTWNIGKKASLETKAKMSATCTGKKLIIVNHKNRAKTHCPQGHEYSPQNTRYSRKGSRQCIACQQARNKSWSEQHTGYPRARAVDRTPVPCACGCGTMIVPYDSRRRLRRFAHGHNGQKKSS